MDPAVLAAAVMGVLGPYLTKAGEAVAKKVGEAAWTKVTQIHAAIKAKLAGNDYAKQTLERLEQKPEDESRRAALQGVLAEELEADEAFLQQLQQLWEEADQAGAQKTITQQVNVSNGGEIGGSVIQIGEASGPVNLGGGKQP